MFKALSYGVTGRFLSENKVVMQNWNPRDYSGVGGYVDDRPYGGGPGMVMAAPPLAATLDAIKNVDKYSSHVIYLSPTGKKIDHNKLKKLLSYDSLTLLCGRYEGIDKRFCDKYVSEELSLGDFVISGGELAAMVLVDALLRLIPGCLGNTDSAIEDSFYSGLLDHDHYTRPDIFEGVKVPEVLLQGEHANINSWRLQQSLGKTWLNRPELLPAKLDCNQKELLLQYVANCLVTHEEKA